MRLALLVTLLIPTLAIANTANLHTFAEGQTLRKDGYLYQWMMGDFRSAMKVSDKGDVAYHVSQPSADSDTLLID